ncbi:hypothetical protein [Halobacillus aidingensis]|uniref:Uncharacterized protein n=1 Tax=Halobacillus aidingensis TaxID=240303 RepID=A0A1H0QRA1_HALAD|nr:hypothetical protein [Halobacillus aidingensis]SDP19792.1 hypothetical protein SAMN05421677_11398 [Halobacillus aidingensis]
MKAFRIFIAVCGVMAILWMTVSLFHEGFNPSSQTNALIIGALFLLLAVENWMDDQKKYAAFYFLLAFIQIALMI